MQCPNCGYYKNSEETYFNTEKSKVDRPTKDIFKDIFFSFLLHTVWLIIIIFPIALIGSFIRELNILSLLVLIGYMFLMYKEIRNALEPEEKIINREVDYIRYKCKECGYSWTRQ